MTRSGESGHDRRNHLYKHTVRTMYVYSLITNIRNACVYIDKTNDLLSRIQRSNCDLTPSSALLAPQPFYPISLPPSSIQELAFLDSLS